jgi:hypothetical protein
MNILWVIIIGDIDCQRSFNLVVRGCQRHSLGQGFDPRLRVKKISFANSTQITWSRPGQLSWAMSPCVWMGKVHVPQHKLMTGLWVVLTGDGSLYMGGCEIREVFSICVRMLLLNIKPWGRSFPYRSSFFIGDIDYIVTTDVLSFHYTMFDRFEVC